MNDYSHSYQPEINARSIKMLENARVDPVEQTRMRWQEREQQIEAEFKEKTKFKP